MITLCATRCLPCILTSERETIRPLMVCGAVLAYSGGEEGGGGLFPNKRMLIPTLTQRGKTTSLVDVCSLFNCSLHDIQLLPCCFVPFLIVPCTLFPDTFVFAQLFFPGVPRSLLYFIFVPCYVVLYAFIPYLIVNVMCSIFSLNFVPYALFLHLCNCAPLFLLSGSVHVCPCFFLYILCTEAEFMRVQFC